MKTLRGVRGERLVIETQEIGFSRPIRLLHPRFASYIVPWGDGRFLVGATVIESDDDRDMTVRSALELLGLAYALHPAFGEAQILEMTAGVRPAFADNVPRVVAGLGQGGKIIRVNGAFRHGFLPTTRATILGLGGGDFLVEGRSGVLLDLLASHVWRHTGQGTHVWGCAR